jgi:hypothetical protein
MVLDLSVGRQTYIEDCEVCCKPIEVSFTVEDDELASFSAQTLGCNVALPSISNDTSLFRLLRSVNIP